MNDRCALVRELAEELALDLVTGEERVAALAHLEECHSCRVEVAELTEAADSILLLAPSAAPDPGFADRVLTRIGAPAPGDGVVPLRPRQGSTRRRPAVLAAAAVVLLVLLAAAAVAPLTQQPALAAVADMRAANDEVVGRVALVDGDGMRVEMDLPGWDALVRSYEQPGSQYWLDLDLDDGARHRVALEPDGDGTWTVPVGVDAADVAAVAISGDDGRVWCRAVLT
jgi:hypothetical protein